MDEYLKIVLEQIRCKKARPYIRQELQDHIEDQIEANISAGLNRTDAEKEAVKDMGDPVEAGLSLDRIHKPQIAWKLLHPDPYGDRSVCNRRRNSYDTQICIPCNNRNRSHDDFIFFRLYITGKIF